jgi:hypothetical protein
MRPQRTGRGAGVDDKSVGAFAVQKNFSHRHPFVHRERPTRDEKHANRKGFASCHEGSVEAIGMSVVMSW